MICLLLYNSILASNADQYATNLVFDTEIIISL